VFQKNPAKTACVTHKTVIVANVGRQCVVFLQSLKAFSVKSATPRSRTNFIHLSQQAVSATFQKNQAQNVDHFYRLKTCCLQRMAQNLKCILCRITFYLEKLFIDEPKFLMERQKGLAGNWLKLAFPFYVLFIVCVGDFTLLAAPVHMVLFGLGTVLLGSFWSSRKLCISICSMQTAVTFPLVLFAL
jgi:hypothetical protein